MEWLIVVFWLAAVRLANGLLDQALKRGWGDAFAARKLMHLGLGVSVIPLAAWIRNWYAAAGPVGFILAGNAAANLHRLPERPRWVRRVYPVAAAACPAALILLAWHWDWRREIALAVLAMSVGDVLAAWAGRRWGRRRFGQPGKTLAGAVANFLGTAIVVSAAGAFLFQVPAGLIAPAALLTGATGAVIEALLPGAWDNPAVVMATLLLLRWALG